MNKVTLVLGGSLNEGAYSNTAIKKLRAKGFVVAAIGRKKGLVLDVAIQTDKNLKDIDTVTLYLNPKSQKEYYSYVLSLKPRRVIFNPGTENQEFIKLLAQNNIGTEIACTLVLLSLNQYE